jgi:hypothetical protein
VKHEEYIAGGHHFWIHFWCGLVVGVGLGAWISSGAFDSKWAVVGSTAAIALVTAYSCGRWGDRMWHRIIQAIGWF